MKSMRYFLLISILLLASVADAYACLGPYFQPSGYLMFRVYDDESAAKADAVRENCLAWQRLTSMTIPLEDIRYVVYTMSLEEYEAFYDSGEYNGNKFARWIYAQDREIMEFLLLAKTNEEIRLHRSSRWYYPTMHIDARMTIEEVVEKSVSSTSKRLRDRYLLQAIRAMFSLGNYEECIRLWDDEMSTFPHYNAMRKLAQPYIAGAEFHLGHSEKCFQYYAELGDDSSIEYCLKKMGRELSIVELIELVYKYAPNSIALDKLIQRAVREVEIWNEGGDYVDYKAKVESQSLALYKLSLRIANEGKTSNPAMWYYAASFMADLRGNTQQAVRLLSMAEKAKGTPCVQESIKVLRIYLDAKTQAYDSAYEQKLFGQLRWLDDKIKNNITPEVRDITVKGYGYQNINKSYYYWNDMMRRVLLSVVCPRMIEQGKQTRALQLANMADNRLLGLVNAIETYGLTYKDKEAGSISTGGGKLVEIPLNTFRRSTTQFNDLDYSNNFFHLIDSIGLKHTIAYHDRVKAPKSDFDSFLNERGYVDEDYLLDIVGTQCLRNMRYADAEQYLGSIAPSFYGHLNVCQTHKPFALDYNEREYNDTDFRYQFAKEMNALERKIATVDNPNVKAQAMVCFAIGLRNSFDWCWSLTQYFRGECVSFYNEPKQWLNGEEMKAAYKRVDELIATACDIVTDRELAAKIQYDFCNYREVATKYYDTTFAKEVWGKCDNLIDYHTEKARL